MRFDRRLVSGVVLRHAAVCLAVAALALPAGAALAARVVDLRVGQHADHTRVVIELDQPSRHRLERTTDGEPALAVRLDARGDHRRVASKSALVESVTLEPAGAGSVARIELREKGLDYSEMILESPPRIVIDVRRVASAAARPTRAAPAQAARAVAAPNEPLGSAPAAVLGSTASPPDSAPEEGQPTAAGATSRHPSAASATEHGPSAPLVGDRDPSAAAAADRDPFVPPASYRALVAAQQAAGEAPLAPAQEIAAGDAEPTGVAAPAAAPLVAAAPAPPAASAPAPPSPPRSSPPPVAAAPPGGPDRVPSIPPPGSGSPTGFGAILVQLRQGLVRIESTPVLFLLAILVAAWIVYRRLVVRRTRERALHADEDELGVFRDMPSAEPVVGEEMEAGTTAPALALAAAELPPDLMPPDTAGESGRQAGADGTGALAEPEIVMPAEHAGERRTPWLSLVASPEAPPEDPSREPPQLALPLPEPPDEPQEGWLAIPVPPPSGSDEPSATTAPGEPEPTAPALLRRLALLEDRIEELLEARERLERHAAAQNEELRVQRAAIARTQRVLRTVARPDDPAASDEERPTPPPATE